jgi:hypothetical protein
MLALTHSKLYPSQTELIWFGDVSGRVISCQTKLSHILQWRNRGLPGNGTIQGYWASYGNQLHEKLFATLLHRQQGCRSRYAKYSRSQSYNLTFIMPERNDHRQATKNLHIVSVRRRLKDHDPDAPRDILREPDLEQYIPEPVFPCGFLILVAYSDNGEGGRAFSTEIRNRLSSQTPTIDQKSSPFYSP